MVEIKNTSHKYFRIKIPPYNGNIFTSVFIHANLKETKS